MFLYGGTIKGKRWTGFAKNTLAEAAEALRVDERAQRPRAKVFIDEVRVTAECCYVHKASDWSARGTLAEVTAAALSRN